MRRDIFTRNLIYKYWIQETMLNMLYQIWIINALNMLLPVLQMFMSEQYLDFQ